MRRREGRLGEDERLGSERGLIRLALRIGRDGGYDATVASVGRLRRGVVEGFVARVSRRRYGLARRGWPHRLLMNSADFADFADFDGSNLRSSKLLPGFSFIWGNCNCLRR